MTGNSLSFTYDALSRRLSETGPQGTATSDWDLAGRRSKLTYPGTGLYLDYDRLVTGEVTAIRENGATSGIGVLATYAYDDLGRRTAVAYGNGTGATYGYDPVSRLVSLADDLTGTTDDLTITINGYNPASQIVSQTRSNDAYAWTGHGSGSTAYAVNNLDQYTTIAKVATAYDANGNMTYNPATGRAYSYTSQNLLSGATATGVPATTLTHDPQMRLYEVASSATTRFAYDGNDPIAEYDGSNALQRRYVFGPGTNEPIVQYEGTGTTARYWLQSDERGSVVAMSDGSGNAILKNAYDEYGRPGAANGGRFLYTGQMYLPEAAAYWYKARVYEPALGRFLQTDPIGYEGGMNLYAYVGNDPVNRIDPTGTVQDMPTLHLPYSSGGLGFYNLAIQRTDLYANGDVSVENFYNNDYASGGSSHDYPVGPLFICNVSTSCTAAIKGTFPSYVVPNSKGPVSDGQITAVYAVDGLGVIVGHVVTYYSSGGFAASNLTLSDHWLCCGQVDITNFQYNGSWYVSAHGYGSNYPGVGWLNQYSGPGIFSGMLQTYISVVRAKASRGDGGLGSDM